MCPFDKTNQTFGEVDCVAYILKDYIYPKMLPHQQALAVPGLYGQHGGDAGEDTQLVAKFEKYWAMAGADDKVVGLNPW